MSLTYSSNPEHHLYPVIGALYELYILDTSYGRTTLLALLARPLLVKCQCSRGQAMTLIRWFLRRIFLRYGRGYGDLNWTWKTKASFPIFCHTVVSLLQPSVTECTSRRLYQRRMRPAMHLSIPLHRVNERRIRQTNRKPPNLFLSAVAGCTRCSS